MNWLRCILSLNPQDGLLEWISDGEEGRGTVAGGYWESAGLSPWAGDAPH